MPTKAERVLCLIDGSNFYHRVKEIFPQKISWLKFDHRGLMEHLAHGRPIVEIGYYVGVVREDPARPKSQRLVREQQRLFAYLGSPHQKLQVYRGYMMRHASGDYKEKGVDVQLAVEIVDGAWADRYDTAILVSSDTDLIPAIRRARDHGKKIEHIGFSHRPSFGLQKAASESHLLNKFDLQPFVHREKLDVT